ncbi:MAG: hypothetical protein K0Q52_180 [Microbacterium sp.]|jgi:hypothetical protein|nr:hypothetical protein [Microbacterium sp.]
MTGTQNPTQHPAQAPAPVAAPFALRITHAPAGALTAAYVADALRRAAEWAEDYAPPVLTGADALSMTLLDANGDRVGEWNVKDGAPALAPRHMTPSDLAEAAAARVVTARRLDRTEGETALAALGWAMGEQIEHARGMTLALYATAVLDAHAAAGCAHLASESIGTEPNGATVYRCQACPDTWSADDAPALTPGQIAADVMRRWNLERPQSMPPGQLADMLAEAARIARGEVSA